jgi:trigger factor
MKRKLLDQLAAAHDFDVPPSMVDAEFNQIWAQLEHEASHEADPAKARAEMEADREDYRRIAERRVRLGLLLSEIGTKNGVEITQAEMNRLIAQAASQYQGKDRETFIRYVQQEPMAAAQLRAPLYEDKVVDFLFSKADVSERKASRAEIEADLESEEGHVHGPGCGHDLPQARPAKGKKPAKAKAEAKPQPEAPAKGPVGKAPAKPRPAKPLKEAAAAKAPAKKAAAPKAEARKAPAKKAPRKG